MISHDSVVWLGTGGLTPTKRKAESLMKRLLVGATAALTAVALSGGLTSAQDGAYTFPPGSGVTGSTTCVDVPGPPQLTYNITFSGAKTEFLTYRLSFTKAGAPYGVPVVVPTTSGAVTFPPGANYTAEGWTLQTDTDPDQLVPGSEIFASETGVRVIAEVIDNGDGGAIYTSAPSLVIFDDVDCLPGVLPPETTTTTTISPQPPVTTVPEAPPTTQPEQVLPPPPPATQPPAQRPLPSAGLSTLESSLRIGALLLIGGLGIVIVARRRRYTTSPTPAT